MQVGLKPFGPAHAELARVRLIMSRCGDALGAAIE
jgi:hypothetical protein